MIAGPHAAFSCYPRICGVQLLAPNFRPLYSRLCSQLLCPPRYLLCLLFLLAACRRSCTCLPYPCLIGLLR